MRESFFEEVEVEVEVEIVRGENFFLVFLSLYSLSLFLKDNSRIDEEFLGHAAPDDAAGCDGWN